VDERVPIEHLPVVSSRVQQVAYPGNQQQPPDELVRCLWIRAVREILPDRNRQVGYDYAEDSAHGQNPPAFFRNL
jgi:hypothetical protein